MKITLPKFPANFNSLKLLKAQKFPQPATLIFLIFTSALMFNFAGFINHYFNHYPKQSAYDWQDGYGELAQVILAENSSVRTVWVTPFENRFYLWLLINPKFTAQQIQAMPKSGYTIPSVENVVFLPFDWEKLNSLDHELIIVGEPNNLRWQMAQYALQPNWIREIKSHDGVVRFLVVHYGQ